MSEKKVPDLRLVDHIPEPDHPTFELVLRDSGGSDDAGISPDFRQATLEKMKQKLREAEMKKKQRRKYAFRAAAAAALVTIALVATPLGRHAVNAAKDLYRTINAWTDDLFHVDKKGENIEITDTRLANNFMFVTIRSDSEVMLHCTGEIYDDDGNTAKLYSGYELSTRDNDPFVPDDGSYDPESRYLTRKKGETLLYAPDLHKVVNSAGKSYHCRLKVAVYDFTGPLKERALASAQLVDGDETWLLDGIGAMQAEDDILPGGISPKEIYTTEFDIPSDKVDSVLNSNIYHPDGGWQDNRVSVRFVELSCSSQSASLVMEIASATDRPLAGEIDVPVITAVTPRINVGGYMYEGTFTNREHTVICGDDCYYTLLEYRGEIEKSHVPETDPNPGKTLIDNPGLRKLTVKSCDYGRYETSGCDPEYSGLENVTLPVSYDSAKGIRRKYSNISFSLSDGVTANVLGLYESSLISEDLHYGTPYYYIPLSLDFAQTKDLMGLFTVTNPGVYSLVGPGNPQNAGQALLEGALLPTGGNCVISARSGGKEMFRVRGEFVVGQYYDFDNGISCDARIVFGNIERIAGYDGHGIFTVETKDDIYSLRKSNGTFLSLSGMVKKYGVDSFRLIALGYNEVKYAYMDIITDAAEAARLEQEGYTVDKQVEMINGEETVIYWVIGVESERDIMLVSPDCYDLAGLRSYQVIRRIRRDG